MGSRSLAYGLGFPKLCKLIFFTKKIYNLNSIVVGKE